MIRLSPCGTIPLWNRWPINPIGIRKPVGATKTIIKTRFTLLRCMTSKTVTSLQMTTLFIEVDYNE